MISGVVYPNVMVKKISIKPNGYAVLYHTKMTNLAHAKIPVVFHCYSFHCWASNKQ